MLRILLLLIALLVGQAFAVQGQEASPQTGAAPATALDLKVIDAETRRPVADATVWVNADEARQSLKTDATGHCRIELAKGRPAVLWFQVMQEDSLGPRSPGVSMRRRSRYQTATPWNSAHRARSRGRFGTRGARPSPVRSSPCT